MELQQKFDFDATAGASGDAGYSSMTMEEELAFSSGRKLRVNPSVVGLGVGVLVVCGIVVVAVGGNGDGGGGGGTAHPAVAAPASVAATDCFAPPQTMYTTERCCVPPAGDDKCWDATYTFERCCPTADAPQSSDAANPAPPPGSCAAGAPVAHGDSCESGVASAPCQVQCLDGYGAHAGESALYVCVEGAWSPALGPLVCAATPPAPPTPPEWADQPMGNCPPRAPVLHSVECEETALHETCTVHCLPGYGATVDAQGDYRCSYREGMQQPYVFTAVGDALRCSYNPSLPHPHPPPPPPPPSSRPPPPPHGGGPPGQQEDPRCPHGCRHMQHTDGSFLSGTTAWDRCLCLGNAALSGNYPPPANYSLGADISVHAVGGVVDFSGHINVYKTLVRQAVGTGDFVVRGVCQDVGVSDFDSVDGRTCDAEEVTCDKAHAGTSPLDGSTIAAPRACCKCPGGGLTPPDYSIGGRCKFDYDISGTVGYTEHFSVSGAGLLNLNNGTTLIKSCNSKDGDPEECKCADSRVTMDDLNWYANNIPWNVDMMTYGYTKCTAASSSHGAPSCEDYYHVDLSAFENFNRDNNGGAPPVIYYVYHHVDGSSPAMGGRVGHGIALQRIEGTINAQITITFTVTVRSQTMHPVELDSTLYTHPPCYAPHRENCECHFPFNYEGHTYNECTSVEETSPWCALEVGGKGHGDDDDPNAFEPHINDWAFCDSPTTCH